MLIDCIRFFPSKTCANIDKITVNINAEVGESSFFTDLIVSKASLHYKNHELLRI